MEKLLGRTPELGCSRKEVKLFFNLAWPNVIIQLCSFAIPMFNAMYTGTNLGTTELAAVSLANLAGNITGMSLVFGFLSAVDTLAPQAMGANRLPEVGQVAVRGFLVCLLVCIPAFIMWWFMSYILTLLGQPEEVCVLAGEFLRIYCLGVPATIYVESTRRFLQCQNIVKPFVWVMAISALIMQPMYLIIFVKHMSMGVSGVATAVVLCSWTQAILTTLHVFCNQPDNPGALWIACFDGKHDQLTLPPLDMNKILDKKEVLQFLRLALPGVLGMSEWWLWELLAFMAGRLGTVALAAHSICYNVVPMAFMIPFGISIGLNTRIGTLLGDAQPDTARNVARGGLSVAIGLCVVYSWALLVTRDHISRQFSSDPAVINSLNGIWTQMCLFLFMDNIFCGQRGIMVALGYQAKMSRAIFISLWCIGVPALWYFTFQEGLGLPGLWTTLPLTYIILNSMLYWDWSRANWEEISKFVRNRT
eukprot:m.158896 g.158896  ORF g.158896 m.158896 type:complete len:476 (+) comp15141_c0_seq12:316-1743(+)